VTDFDEVIPELYEELRRVARRALRGERGGHTLQATALVHEAYLKLAQLPALRVTDRKQLLALAARAIRQVLVDYARSRRRAKRGGEPLRVTLSEGFVAPQPSSFDLVALDEALRRLEQVSGQHVRVIELRYLAGLSVEEAAEVLEVSTATVKRDTSLAKAWLYRELLGQAG
jgi:RNA polymerase sigma factor (TIGR02999 family)